jgi:hypothetical protein
MSFRLGVFIEAIASRTEADKKTRATNPDGANGKSAKRRVAPRKPVDVRNADGEKKGPPAHSGLIDSAQAQRM